jgi:predicted 2-oxoglutarate/Fe(II)-dependent dioxygenase YbiX
LSWITQDLEDAASALEVWDAFVSRNDCLRAVAAMTGGSAMAARVLRSGEEFADARLRSCSEHVLSDEQSDAVVTGLRQAAGVAIRANSWSSAKLDGPKYCTYPAGGYFRAHRDRSTDPRDPSAVRARTLTLVCMLNDDDPSGGMPTFDGGALVVYFPQRDGSIAPVNLRPPAGSIVGFPADLMHEVRPVRSGTRCTAVAWLYDPEPAADEEEL